MFCFSVLRSDFRILICWRASKFFFDIFASSLWVISLSLFRFCTETVNISCDFNKYRIVSWEILKTFNNSGGTLETISLNSSKGSQNAKPNQGLLHFVWIVNSPMNNIDGHNKMLKILPFGLIEKFYWDNGFNHKVHASSNTSEISETFLEKVIIGIGLLF